MKLHHISQMVLFTGILELLDSMGVNEGDPALLNIVANAATNIVKECARERVMASDGMGLSRWLCSDDTGLSSRFMAAVLSGAPLPENHYPGDCWDFGRCVRLLRAAPELRANLGRMANEGPIWAKILSHWELLEGMYDAKDYQGICSTLQECSK
jgi:hypothetical protein